MRWIADHSVRYNVKMPHITAVAFDIGNVLLRVYHAKTRAALAEYAGVTTEFVKETVFGKLHDDIECGLMTPEEFRKRASALLGKDIPFDFFAHAWNDVFEENRDVVPLLERLEAKYRLLLISNTDPMHFAHIGQYEAIGRFFDDPARRTLSFEVGARKPSPAIYGDLIAKAGTSANGIVYVDDMLEFCEAFRALGGHALNYNAKTMPIAALAEGLRSAGVET